MVCAQDMFHLQRDRLKDLIEQSFDGFAVTQLEVADMLGVSDSLVSDYRKRIEANLQELSFSGVNEARQFEKALKRKVREMISVEKEQVSA